MAEDDNNGGNVPTNQEVLDCPLHPDNDAKAATVRDYLKALLTELWREEEGFDGKRPFGNSSWQYDVYVGLGKAGYIECELDADGYVQHVNREAADELIYQAIKAL